MGAEQSLQRTETEGREVFETYVRNSTTTTTKHPVESKESSDSSVMSVGTGAIKKRSALLRHTTTGNKFKQSNESMPSPTSSEISRPSSPPLSVCSDLPYVSYTTDRPIGDSPKMRNKPHCASNTTTRATSLIIRRPNTGTKSKRPQSLGGAHNIVIVKPGIKDDDDDLEPEMQQLRQIPQFMPVLRHSITSSTFTRDPDVLERLKIEPHFFNICSRMQAHLNLCATVVAQEQSQLIERTKIVSNSITTLFATFVDMQKTYAAYAEQFAKVRLISQQLSRCHSLLCENMDSLETLNNFLPAEERLEPFLWHTDDNKIRGEAEGAVTDVNAPLQMKRL